MSKDLFWLYDRPANYRFDDIDPIINKVVKENGCKLTLGFRDDVLRIIEIGKVNIFIDVKLGDPNISLRRNLEPPFYTTKDKLEEELTSLIKN